MKRISPGPTRWPPGAERRLVPAKSNLKPQTFDKLLVKSTQSNELSNFMNRSWRRPTSNDLDLFGVHVYSILVDDVSTEGYSTLKECGFIDAGKELVLTE